MTWGLVTSAAVVPAPVPRPAGAVLWPAPGPEGALEVALGRLVESPAGATAAAVAERAAVLVVTRGGRDGR